MAHGDKLWVENKTSGEVILPRVKCLNKIHLTGWQHITLLCRETHCLNDHIIYDKFHLIRHLLEALNKVCHGELKKAACHLKGLLADKKFIILSRQAHVWGKVREALNQLLSAGKKLLKSYLPKESFEHLWSYTSKT